MCVVLWNNQSSLWNRLALHNGHHHARSMASWNPWKEGQNDRNKNRFLATDVASMHRSSSAWSEQREGRASNSCPRNRASQSRVMKHLSILSNVGWHLSLLQVNSLPSRWISSSDASLINRQNWPIRLLCNRPLFCLVNDKSCWNHHRSSTTLDTPAAKHEALQRTPSCPPPWPDQKLLSATSLHHSRRAEPSLTSRIVEPRCTTSSTMPTAKGPKSRIRCGQQEEKSNQIQHPLFAQHWKQISHPTLNLEDTKEIRSAFTKSLTMSLCAMAFSPRTFQQTMFPGSMITKTRPRPLGV
jgi:hypothetical protein